LKYTQKGFQPSQAHMLRPNPKKQTDLKGNSHWFSQVIEYSDLLTMGT